MVSVRDIERVNREVADLRRRLARALRGLRQEARERMIHEGPPYGIHRYMNRALELEYFEVEQKNRAKRKGGG